MQSAPIPANEEERLDAVRAFNILDTPTEERYDRITRAAVERFQVPIATITIVDRHREWFKSCYGTTEQESGRDISFCGHSLLAKEIFVVADTLNDPRFADNPQVTGPAHIRFYAGVALHDRKTHLPIGTFCIKDVKPRSLTKEEFGWIIDFAAQAEDELNHDHP